MSAMETFSDIIGSFGGPAKFAEAINIKGFHAQSMKERDSIPPAYWADTVSAALQRDIEGVTLEKLADLAKAKRPQSEPAQ
jgi:hypothetical protein